MIVRSISLDFFRNFFFLRTDNDRRRDSLAHLFRMGRTGKHCNLRLRNFLLDDLRKRHQRVFFHALCNVYDDLSLCCHIL